MKVLFQTRTVGGYISVFEILEKDTGFNEPGLNVAFKVGLQAKFINRIYRCEHVPDTFQKWKDITICAD
jgi:hypothetical protein